MTEPSLDTLLQLVADRRRRQAIYHLRHEADGKATVDDLVDWLHDGGSEADDGPTDRKQLLAQMCHTHLPKLADHGVVEFEPGNGAIRYQPDERFETILDTLSGELSVPSS